MYVVLTRGCVKNAHAMLAHSDTSLNRLIHFETCLPMAVSTYMYVQGLDLTLGNVL